jgi:cytochrome c-type biogenesis protein CcmH/NrfG
MNDTPVSLKDLTNIKPEVTDVAHQMAAQMFAQRRFTDLETVLKGLLAVERGDERALSLYTTMLREQGRAADARSVLEVGLKRNPSSSTIQKLLQGL